MVIGVGPVTTDGTGRGVPEPQSPASIPSPAPSIPASHPLDDPNRRQEFGEGARVIHPREPGT